MAYNWRKQASVSYGYALSRLALNAYMFLEQMPLSGEGRQGWRQETEKHFMGLLGAFLEESQPEEEAEKKLGLFRQQLGKRMETVVAFTDAFQVYEYAWNRLERRFVQGLPPMEVNEDEFVGNLMRYLSSTKEPAIQNQRIQQIVRQLPVRFTRRKFYSLVHEALTSYIGSDPAGLEEVMYLLRSGCMLELSRERRESYPDLDGLLRELESLPFKGAEKGLYQGAQEKIGQAGAFLADESECILAVQEMANDLYILYLTKGSALQDAAEKGHAYKILGSLWHHYQNGGRQAPQGLEKELEGLEGVQEKYDEEYQRLDLSWEYQPLDHQTARWARLVERLMSTSDFASLEERQVLGSASREDVDKASDRFFSQLEPVLASVQKPVARAIMAMALSSLPVFFHSPKEIQGYIKDSLGCCSDPAEKETCLELLHQMMESDGYELV